MSESKVSISAAWSKPVAHVLEALASDRNRGLDRVEVERRLRIYGTNQLRKHRPRSPWMILLDQVKSLIILLLVAAMGVSFLFNEMMEGWAIAAVIVINTGIGFFTELRATRSMESLHRLGKVETRVLREGRVESVSASDLVPGDIVLLEAGDVITADLRIVEGSKLQADESALTGESLPTGKKSNPVDSDAALADRISMLYKGTSLTRGSGTGVVVTTGLETELGQISELVEETSGEQTPLEKRLDRLGYRLILLALGTGVFIAVSGVVAGKDTLLMIQTGIALAVAAIPEGLPIVATIALAKGLQIMAEKNALIRRLSAVETLGAIQTIFTDKTGTLTENRMEVVGLILPAGEVDLNSIPEGDEHPDIGSDLERLLETGILCNNATLADETGSSDNGYGHSGTGDPLEVALLEAGRTFGLEQAELQYRYPEAGEEAFDPEVKMMATWNSRDSRGFRLSVKGAPDAVWDHCTYLLKEGRKMPFTAAVREEWEEKNRRMADDGLRMIALAYRDDVRMGDQPYRELVFLGLAALLDPPRRDIRSAIESCRATGIEVVMVTGDQAGTAAYIAGQVGMVTEADNPPLHGKDLPAPEQVASSLDWSDRILKTRIFARISPRQKLDLITWYQHNGKVVAMTGDGVNDAPALRKADIGIAMGQRGTQVAREAADMVLTDDAFPTIVLAIRQGRVIFSNIRSFVYYLLSCNVSEVFVVGLASMAGAPLPLLPLHILFLNLVTDVFPALALGVGKGSADVMQKPPRKGGEPILNRSHWLGIGAYGLVITAAVLGALFVGLQWLELAESEAVTISFLTLAFAQVWHVFNMSSPTSGMLNNSVVRNRWVLGAIVLCVLLVLAVLYLPATAEVMRLTPPDRMGWLVVGVMSLIPLAAGQIYKVMVKVTGSTVADF